MGVKGNKKLIVFDMDGVLVDVSLSYRDVVRETVYLFFEGARGFDSLPKPMFSLEDLAIVKGSGGLNNDWELTYLVISLLLDRVKIGDLIYEGVEEEKSIYKSNLYYKTNPHRIDLSKNRENLLREFISSIDIYPLSEYLKRKQNPLVSIFKERGRVIHPLVSFFSHGDVETGNVIKRIFQEIYLGTELFEKIYGFKPFFYFGEGFINRERLIIGKDTLDWLSGEHVLAVATGRPRVEAEYALNRFKIDRYFSKVLTLDDCVEEEFRILKKSGTTVSLSKPHPYMLDELAGEFSGICSEFYLVGDMPDDMISASRSSFGYVGIGFVAGKEKNADLRSKNDEIAENLRRHGAKEVFFSVKELKNFLSNF